MRSTEQEWEDYAEGLRQARIRPERKEGKMIIAIPGKPVSKARPRFVRRGEGVITFNPQVTEEGKWLLIAKGQVTETMTGPVRVSCEFAFERPKSHFGTGRNAEQLKKSAPIYHTQKPDIDNLVKFVNDCLNGVAYRDDSQIVMIHVDKVWGEQARTEIRLEQEEI